MYTIRGRLLQSFLGVIAALSLTSLLFLALSFYLTAQYRSISDAMIAEYQLVENTATLIDAFNRRVQSAGAENVAAREQQRIVDAQKSIRELIAILDKQPFDTQSASDYLGFRASVEKFTMHIDESLRRFEVANVKDYFADFNEANKQYGFVRENGTTALFSQLKYTTLIREQIEKTYRASVFFGGIALAVIVAICTIFVLQFSRRLVRPLAALSEVAEKIAAGDTSTGIDSKLFGNTVEIRSLGRSIETMVRRLLENVAKVDSSNKELAESSSILRSQNHELAQLNRLMVGRELKMAELKNEIERLKAASPTKDSKSA